MQSLAERRVSQATNVLHSSCCLKVLDPSRWWHTFTMAYVRHLARVDPHMVLIGPQSLEKPVALRELFAHNHSGMHNRMHAVATCYDLAGPSLFSRRPQCRRMLVGCNVATANEGGLDSLVTATQKVTSESAMHLVCDARTRLHLDDLRRICINTAITERFHGTSWIVPEDEPTTIEPDKACCIQ